MTNANNALVAQLQTISFPDSSMLEFWPGFHVCGLNKIIPDWKRNSQSGCPVESELQ